MKSTGKGKVIRKDQKSNHHSPNYVHVHTGLITIWARKEDMPNTPSLTIDLDIDFKFILFIANRREHRNTSKGPDAMRIIASITGLGEHK